MPTLSAFLDLTTEDARLQWQRILARQPAERQEPYLPVEVLLCYALFWVLDPHSYGGGNMERLPAEARTLADTFRRSPGSLPSKMLNLDGSRKNCGRLEPELFRILSTEPERFAALYVSMMRAARMVGLDEAQVPDVLHGFDERTDLLLGQEELGQTEINLALDEQRPDIHAMGDAWNMPEQETVRIAEQRIRLGQHRFAYAVLRNYGFQCAFCGFAPHHMVRHRFLVASHIKPWRVAEGRERLDPRNGIAACPMHDTAFDGGLITVNGGLRIHKAPTLLVSLAEDVGTSHYFDATILRERLLVPAGALAPDSRYLDWHREHVFQVG